MTIIDSFYIVPKDLTNTPTGLATEWGSPPETVITVSWNAVTDINGAYPAGYKIIRDGSIVGTVGHDTLTFSDTGLSEAISYDYQIASTDRWDNISTYSSVVTKATKDSTAPSVPAFLTAITGSPPISVINLSWTASTDNSGIVSSYVVYRHGYGFGGSPVGSPYGGSPYGGSPLGVVTGSPLLTTYKDTGLDPSTEYIYKVSAKDPSGNESALSAPAYETTAYNAPAIDFRAAGSPLEAEDYFTNSTMSITDGKVGTMSFWFYADTLTNSSTIFSGPTGGSTAADSSIYVTYGTGDGGSIVVGASDVDELTLSTLQAWAPDMAGFTSQWVHCLIAWDIGSPPEFQFYVNGLDTYPTVNQVDTSANIEYSKAISHEVGNFSYATLSEPWNEHLTEFWFDPTTKLDITDKAVRDKFYDADNYTPVYLGNSGQLPTGSAVPIYMTGSPATFGDNLGTGGSFTKMGTIDSSSVTPVVAEGTLPFTESFTSISGAVVSTVDTWETIDISTYATDVPPSVVIAVLCTNDIDTANVVMGVDEVGGSDTAKIDLVEAEGGGKSTALLWVQINSSKQARLYTSNITAGAKFYVLGWFGENVTYNRLDSSDTHTASAGWEDMTMANHSASSVATVLIGNLSNAISRDTMIREIGDTDTYDFINLNEAESTLFGSPPTNAEWFSRTVNLDSSKQFEMYSGATSADEMDIKSYGELSGLTYTPATAAQWNAQRSTGLADTWDDWALTLTPFSTIPAGAVVEVVCTNNSATTEHEVGVRSGGSAVDSYLLLHESEGSASSASCATMYATVDRNRVIELYSGDGDVDVQFRIAGWFTDV